MKEDRAAEKPLPRPGYNIHQSAGDPGCFVQHMEAQKFPKNKMPENAVGAAYGSEENYAWLEKREIGNYLKYARFHKEQHPLASLNYERKNVSFQPTFPTIRRKTNSPALPDIR